MGATRRLLQVARRNRSQGRYDEGRARAVVSDSRGGPALPAPREAHPQQATEGGRMTLQRLVLDFRNGELVVRCLYRSKGDSNPATKGRRREVAALTRTGLPQALEVLEAGVDVDMVGTSGFTSREAILSRDTRSQEAHLLSDRSRTRRLLGSEPGSGRHTGFQRFAERAGAGAEGQRAGGDPRAHRGSGANRRDLKRR